MGTLLLDPTEEKSVTNVQMKLFNPQFKSNKKVNHTRTTTQQQHPEPKLNMVKIDFHSELGQSKLNTL